VVNCCMQYVFLVWWATACNLWCWCDELLYELMKWLVPVLSWMVIITWCKLYASYNLFGAESLFYLAVLDCFKPDIDQVASVVYCMIEWKLKTTDQTFNAATQNITGRAISYGMDENDNTLNARRNGFEFYCRLSSTVAYKEILKII
jgi:hypothetical protein